MGNALNLPSDLPPIVKQGQAGAGEQRGRDDFGHVVGSSNPMREV
jgi:hypothetical protein